MKFLIRIIYKLLLVLFLFYTVSAVSFAQSSLRVEGVMPGDAAVVNGEIVAKGDVVTCPT